MTEFVIRISALFVAGKVHGQPDPVTTVEAVSISESTDGSQEITNDPTGDEIILVDSTTEDAETTHDRVLFTETPVMDVITLIWYLATFIALVSFFLVMVCADRNRCRSRKPATEELAPPPTPAPSYRQFAPPDYDSLGFGKDNDSIFIIPCNGPNESALQRNVEDLTSNLEYNIEHEAPRQPSSHTVFVSDINEVGDAATVCVVGSSDTVCSNDVINRNVTVL